MNEHVGIEAQLFEEALTRSARLLSVDPDTLRRLVGEIYETTIATRIEILADFTHKGIPEVANPPEGGDD